MLNTGGDPDVPHRPMSTDLVPDFPAMPDLKELIFLHPDYLYLLEGLSLEYTRQLSSISLRCTSVSSISPRSSVRKLLDVLPDSHTYLNVQITLFGCRLDEDAAHVATLAQRGHFIDLRSDDVTD